MGGRRALGVGRGRGRIDVPRLRIGRRTPQRQRTRPMRARPPARTAPKNKRCPRTCMQRPRAHPQLHSATHPIASGRTPLRTHGRTRGCVHTRWQARRSCPALKHAMQPPRTRVHHTHSTRDSAVITRQDVLMSCDRMPRSSRPSVRATLLFELSRAASVQAVYSLAQDVYM